MTEFYDIVDKIRDELRNNPSINTVTFGDLTDVDLDKHTMFPLGHIYIDSVQPTQGALRFVVSILVMDVVDYNKDQTSGDDFYQADNLHDVLNTQLATLNKVVSELKRGTLYKDQFQLDGEPTFEPFKERFKNLLAGWETSVSVLVKNDLKIC